MIRIWHLFWARATPRLRPRKGRKVKEKVRNRRRKKKRTKTLQKARMTSGTLRRGQLKREESQINLLTLLKGKIR